MSNISEIELVSPLAHEIVGSRLTVCDSGCRALVGTSGQVVLETRNMVHIRTDSGIKKIVKEAVKKFYLKNEFGGCFISGSSLIGRPEERVSRTN